MVIVRLVSDAVLLLRCPHPVEPEVDLRGAHIKIYFLDLDLELPNGQGSVLRVALDEFPLFFSRTEDPRSAFSLFGAEVNRIGGL